MVCSLEVVVLLCFVFCTPCLFVLPPLFFFWRYLGDDVPGATSMLAEQMMKFLLYVSHTILLVFPVIVMMRYVFDALHFPDFLGTCSRPASRASMSRRGVPLLVWLVSMCCFISSPSPLDCQQAEGCGRPLWSISMPLLFVGPLAHRTYEPCLLCQQWHFQVTPTDDSFGHPSNRHLPGIVWYRLLLHLLSCTPGQVSPSLLPSMSLCWACQSLEICESIDARIITRAGYVQ
jgi:hypothetical protein